MTAESRHLGVRIARPAAAVHAFASNPANLPRWAPGLGSTVVQEDGEWFVETTEGAWMTDAEFDRDTGLVNGDLALLKNVMEG